MLPAVAQHCLHLGVAGGQIGGREQRGADPTPQHNRQGPELHTYLGFSLSLCLQGEWRHLAGPVCLGVGALSAHVQVQGKRACTPAFSAAGVTPCATVRSHLGQIHQAALYPWKRPGGAAALLSMLQKNLLLAL